MRYFFGADPDLHRSAIALVSEVGQPVGVWVEDSGKKLKERDAVIQAVKDVEASSRSILDGLLVNGYEKVSPTEVEAIAVESQELYRGRGEYDTKNARDIMFLAAVAGGLLASLRSAYFGARLYFPAPQEWKGSVPKDIHQARILGRLGWKYAKAGGKEPYCYPINPPIGHGLGKTDWKHAVDAIGLARWARDQYLEQQTRRGRLAAIESRP